MEKTNNYWTDLNNNKWDCDIYTEEQAEKLSKTLINCFNCINCIDCISCSDCRYCSSCRSCRSCSDCSDFKTNPQRITSNKIGSRERQTTYYWNEETEQIVCGCFKGTLKEFKDAIKKEHNDNKYSKEYFKWIEAVEVYKGLTNKT